MPEKLDRMKQRHPHERDLVGLLHQVDTERIHYADTYFGCDSSDRQMYHVCLNSTIGLDTCAELIVSAIHSAKKQPRRSAPGAS
jgi:hypothetical protein